MSPPDARAVIVFDGTCVLCNGWIDFLLRHDRRGRYRFAAMQAPSGRTLLATHGLDPDDPSSFLLIEGEHAYRDVDGIRRVLTGLGGAWRAAHVLRLIPGAVGDPLYRMLARNRYRWFGRHAACRVPSPAEAERFLQ
ncbi:membrane protein [Lysobacter helvus]|uniref:Membrane protein n=2 Tax=Lysobacteraceae TaxID=32033 RepID=A0ABN6FQ46_9GAMM|nr:MULTISPECIES: thiol-disulfide oxidoreductase DCC family protein [Lysobacter]BCT91729.1 membrane protein [Lysobacter caseinilyticus]BCT94882.1 membrane protein [Lysobacter helvus]